MKKLFILLVLPLSVLGQAGKEVKIKGKLNINKPIDKVMITYRNGEDIVRDSVVLKDGEFKYVTKIAEPTLATFNFVSTEVLVQTGNAGMKNYMMPVFIEPGDIDIKAKDSIQAATVNGSASHKDYLRIKDLKTPFDKQFDSLYTLYSDASKKKDADAMKALDAVIDSIDLKMRDDVFKTFVQNHPKSPIAIWAVGQYAGYEIDPNKAEPVFNLLPANVRTLPSAKMLNDKIVIAKKTGIGQYAMDFTQNDTLDQPVSLSSFRGKYVLVDFWASWCGPCRRENPNVVKVFNDYKDRNFTILSVSLDRPNAKDKWLKAIHDDQLTWTHVSDLKFWDNAVAKQYGIQAIPQNILIDPQGKIIGKNLRGEELGHKLAEIYASKGSN